MKIQFLGHACFLLDDGVCKALVDPFLTGNPLAAVTADQVEADMIFVTHGHGDHVGDAVEIARRTGARVCCPVELAEAVFEPAGIPTVAGNLGGWAVTPFWPGEADPCHPRQRGARRPCLRLPLRWVGRRSTTPGTLP